MGNQEKSELRRCLRRARAQLSGDERAAAEREIGRLLKRRIKRGALYRTAFAADVVHALSC